MLRTDMRWAKVYWAATMGQMFFVCLLVGVLRASSLPYPKVLNLLFIILGGSSSAIWGILVSIKSKRVFSGVTILFDFFDVRQSVAAYGVTILFLAIIFSSQLSSGLVIDGVKWYTFVILFLQSILFGGIEEIGWRYTFGPILEKKFSFILATSLTFVSWGLWHYMYFYLTDTLTYIQHGSFIIGLLGSSFIMGAIYRLSNSLWLCVLFHCLLNVFSQTMPANKLSIVITCNALCIVLALVLVEMDKRNKLRMLFKSRCNNR